MKYSAMLVAAGVLSAGTAFAQQPPIKIGAMYPLTGGGAVYGVPAMAGHQLAVEELNAKGGILGRKIESIERDDKMNPSAASSTMKELITKDKADIIARRPVLGGRARHVGSEQAGEGRLHLDHPQDHPDDDRQAAQVRLPHLGEHRPGRRHDGDAGRQEQAQQDLPSRARLCLRQRPRGRHPEGDAQVRARRQDRADAEAQARRHRLQPVHPAGHGRRLRRRAVGPVGAALRVVGQAGRPARLLQQDQVDLRRRDRQPRDRGRAEGRVPRQRHLQHLRALVCRQRPLP